MTKADIVTKISKKNQIEESVVRLIIQSLIETVKGSLANNDNVYLREFGSFTIVHRAEKRGCNISQKTTVVIPAQNIPVFKPSPVFKKLIK